MNAPPVSAWGLVGDFAYSQAFTDRILLSGGAGNTTHAYKITGSYSERLVVVSFSLQAVGGAGVRTARLDYEDASGSIFASVASPFTVAAGNTSRFTFARNAAQAGANNGPAIVAPLPPIFLAPGESLVVSVIGGLAADTIGVIRGQTEKFSTSPHDFPPGQGPDAPDGY